MRFLCALLVTALSVHAAQTNPGVISGHVMRPDGTTGIAEVQVLIVGPLSGPAANAAITMPAMLEEIAEGAGMPKASATTNSDGRFEFKNLALGQYAIRVQREGYFNEAGNTLTGQSLVLNAAAPSMDLSVKMMRGAVISGRVRDSAGKLSPNASVTAYRLEFQNGREILQTVASKPADDRGEYRLFWLQPGEYYVGSRLSGESPLGMFAFMLTATVPGDEMFRTFYPSTASARAASTIRINEGDNISGIDIDLVGLRATKISGRIINTVTPAGVQPRPTPSGFFLLPRDPEFLNIAAVVSLPNASQVEGEFEIRGVPPGAYDLVATVPDSNGRAYPGHVAIEAGSQDLQGVVFSFRPGVEVKARIYLDEKLIPASVVTSPQPASVTPPTPEALRERILGSSGASSGPRVQLRSKGLYPAPFESAASAGVRADSDGAYVFPTVPEGSYTFTVTGIPGNTYVADIRAGETSIYDSGIVVGEKAPAPIDVMLRSGVQSIRGIVRDADGKPAVGATVILVPAQPHRQNPLLYKNTLTLINGDFSMTNVAPGVYKLFAWDRVPNTAYMNVTFMARFESKGKEITVAAGGIMDFDLSVISGK